MKQVRPKKNLGQHFLTDLTIAKRIADTVDACPDLPVLEVGPGMGVMTQYLVEKPRPLKVVEIDKESVAYLKEFFSRYEDGSSYEVRGTRCGDDSSCEVRGTRYENTSEAELTADMGVQGNLAARTSQLVPRKDAPRKDVPQTSFVSRIIEGDFLRMDLRTVFDGGQFVLTGNYPYDISSQIFFKMIDNRDLIPCCTGMIQREVAQRIASQPGTKAYGILSVMIQAWYDVEYLFTVDENVFNPPPKVKSAVIRMTRNKVQHLDCDEQLFRRVVKTVFGQRRKMLRVSLRQLVGSGCEVRGMRYEQLFSSPFMTKRPEQLTIAQFVELTNMVDAVLKSQ